MPAEQVLSVAQMVASERALMDAGTSVHSLMARAGTGAADWVWRMGAGRPVTVLCGPGNNGGDGYVIARALAERGCAVAVVAPIPPKTEAAQRAAGKYDGQVVSQGADLAGHVFVDCLFGSGLTRPLAEDMRALVAGLQERHDLSIAVDVPSGVDADRGGWPDGIGPFDATISLGAWKRAHWSGISAARMGIRKLVDIGVENVPGADVLWPRPYLSPPAWDAHKYRRGLLAIVAGDMPGAPLLSACAAMAAGAGYVKLLADDPPPAPPVDLVVETGALARTLADARIGAVLVGPGLGRSDVARDRLAATLEAGHPAVLDADALHMLDPDMIEGCDTSRIVATPHEGELAALCDAFGVDAHSKRGRACGLREQTGLTVLAKGPDTVLAHAGGVAFFPGGPSWLSVAGSGDVLAGIIAARLAAGLDPEEAAGQGVYLHHEAARQAGVAFSASELAQKVKCAYAAFL